MESVRARCGCSRDWGAVLAADSWEPCCSLWPWAAIRLEVLMEICDAGELCQARRAPEQRSHSCSELCSCAASSGPCNPSLVLKGQMTLSHFLFLFLFFFLPGLIAWYGRVKQGDDIWHEFRPVHVLCTYGMSVALPVLSVLGCPGAAAGRARLRGSAGQTGSVGSWMTGLCGDAPCHVLASQPMACCGGWGMLGMAQATRARCVQTTEKSRSTSNVQSPAR